MALRWATVWKSAITRVAAALTAAVTLAVAAAAGCSLIPGRLAPPPEKPAMKKTAVYADALSDDMDAASLAAAVEQSVAYLSKIDPGTAMRFGGRTVYPPEMIASLNRMAAIFAGEPDAEKRARRIRNEFDVYESGGQPGGDNALVTGYFQPVLEGRRTRGGRFQWPLYNAPADLVRVDLGRFSKELEGKRITGRVENGRLAPYHDRKEIDFDGAISGRGLEAFWVDDPVDVFFLHVQGSGVVRLENGARVFVNYAASNGRKYRSIGRLLIDEGAIPEEEISLQSIRRYLDENPDQAPRVLRHNPSYVFFRAMDDGPYGSTGAKLVPGRSAAFDPKFFPKGGVAHITVDTPVFKDGRLAGWRKVSRFVFNHDQGGAIKGPGRMDLFFGMGDEAGAAAGVMKNPGRLRWLILKPGVYAKMTDGG